MKSDYIPYTVFTKVFPKANTVLVDLLNLHLPIHKIDTKERVACFLAQCGHESAGFTQFSENLNYSAQALLKVFPKYFKDKDVNQYARQPQKIANLVYANRMGNGNEQSGDGWKYRGRGLIQLTGKNNYFNLANDLKTPDYINNPDLVAMPSHAIVSACWFWNKNNLNTFADKLDMKALTKAINGGYNGLEDRLRLFDKLYSEMPV